MGLREWLLLAMVIVVPLLVAAVVTLWSLKQVQYKRKTVGTVRTSSGQGRRARAETGSSDGSVLGAGAEPAVGPDGSAGRATGGD